MNPSFEIAGDLMITSVVVVHRKVSSGRAWLNVPPDWPVHSVLYDMNTSLGNRLTTPGQIIIYPNAKVMIT